MEPRLKVDVGASSSNGIPTTSHHEPREPPPQQQMPPPSVDWNNAYGSPDQEDLGPFVEQLLPFVRASAYNWFHLQAAKRRHFKDYDRKMSASDENKKLVELQNDRDELKVKWASRLLGKIKKDIQNDHKDAFVLAISGQRPSDCILSVADQKGKMRRIDCLRQADKVWRLDLVTIILFKGIPLESTDGERLERCDSCTMPSLCINPFHMSISVRGLDIFLATYLKDIETKIVLQYIPKKEDERNNDIVVKQEVGEMGIVAPHAVLGTSSTHNRVWENPVTLEYDPQQACHTYFGGRTSYAQSANASVYAFPAKDAIDNNYFDPKRAVLCLPPPPVPICPRSVDFEGQPMDMMEDSNDEPSEKRSRDMSSHDSPNSSTNDEVRRFVEAPVPVIEQTSSVWQPVRSIKNERPVSFRPMPKAVRRMTVNAGNHGDVGVVVVDARSQVIGQPNSKWIVANGSNQQPVSEETAATLSTALNILRTSPLIAQMGNKLVNHQTPAGRKRAHPQSSTPMGIQQHYGHDSVKTGNDVSPPHAIVASLISRESSGYMASPTKFTTARGDTTSFSKILQKVEEKHGAQLQQQQQQQNQPTTSNYVDAQLQPSFIVSKADSTVKLHTPIPIKPSIIGVHGCSPIGPSPTMGRPARLTPYRLLNGDEDVSQSFVQSVLGMHNESPRETRMVGTSILDGLDLQDQFLQYINDTNSRSPLLSANSTFSALTIGNAVAGLPQLIARPDSSASNGSNSLGALTLAAQPNVTLAVSQPTTSMSTIHQARVNNMPQVSPTSSNSSGEAANQAPVSNVPQDPNAPKLPTDFSQALSNEKK